MKYTRFFIYVFLLAAFGFPVKGRSQTGFPDSLIFRLPEKKLTIPLNQLSNDTLKLDSLPAFESSIHFKIGTIRLKKGIHYIPLGGYSYILLHKTIWNPKDTLSVFYRRIPYPTEKDLSLFVIPLQIYGKQGQDSVRVQKEWLEQFESVFSQQIDGLQKNGTFVRGFQIGSNQGLTLNSSLNLFLKGQLSENLSITAALTDENTPIQPEGNTQRLNEVDKVYIIVQSPYVKGTIGDFDYLSPVSPFEKIKRKLQGVWIQTQNPYAKGELLFSTTRGKSHRNIFLGQEGNQGPYVLKGRSGEENIIILAGTERVYVNGELKKRGENLDYIIDYTSGEITFTQNVLISSDTRIEVDFEYLDARQRYLKNFYAFSAGKNWGKLKSRISIYQEKDDINNVLADSAPLDENEKSILSAAGDSLDAAIQNGWTFVGKGKGFYLLRDTVIMGDTLQYFLYDRENGEYLVNFTFVGIGNGSYRRERLGFYIFVGKGNGDYEPIVRIPLPERNRQVVAEMSYTDSARISVQGIFGISDFDNNFLSPKDDQNNRGTAQNLKGWLQIPLPDSWKDLKIRLEGFWDRKETNFKTLDRFYSADFIRKWNLNNLPTGNENRYEINNTWSFKNHNYRFSFGNLSFNENDFSRRINHQLKTGYKFLTEDLGIGFVKSRLGNSETYFENTHHKLTVHLNKNLAFHQFFNKERREETIERKTAGYEYLQLGVGHEFKLGRKLNWKSEMSKKEDRLFIPDSGFRAFKQADILQFFSTFNYRNPGKIQTALTINYRSKNYTPFFEQFQGDRIATFRLNPLLQDTSWADKKSYSVKMNTNLWLFRRQMTQSIEYQVASELTPLKEKVYLKVDEGLGNYRYDEELQEYVPDPAGDYILVIAPGKKYIPTSNVLLLWQMNWRPKNRKGGKSLFRKLASNLILSQRFRVEEKTTHRNLKDIYLLNLTQFQQEGKTIRGTWLSQTDATLFPYNPTWNVIFRSRYQKQFLNIYLNSNDNERRILLRQELTIRYRQSVNFRQEFELIRNRNSRTVPSFTFRNRNVNEVGIGTRSIHKFIAGSDNRLEIFFYRGEDQRKDAVLKAHYIKINDRITASMGKKGRLLMNFKYVKVVEDENPAGLPFPYEMAEGKKPGNNWEWILRFDYFISNFLTFSLDYRGRKDAIFRNTLHTGQMELRAYF